MKAFYAVNCTQNTEMVVTAKHSFGAGIAGLRREDFLKFFFKFDTDFLKVI